MREHKKKVCLIGDFAVGKTSLVRQFVNNVFSERYLSTVGVKIDTKRLVLNGTDLITMVVWDIAGQDSYTSLNENYIKGSSGVILVGDITRPETIKSLAGHAQSVARIVGDVAMVALINKTDLEANPDAEKLIADYHKDSMQVLRTSAKTGDHVEQAFSSLAHKILTNDVDSA